MIRFIIRRVIQAVPTLLGISVLSWLVMAAAPGGPTAAMRLDRHASPRQREEVEQRLGLNDPLYLQYLKWLIGDDWYTYEVTDRRTGEIHDEKGDSKGILRGDLGRSFSYKRPVAELMRERLQPTAELGFLSIFLGFSVGIPIGIVSALKPGSLFDNFTRVASVVLNAFPAYIFGILLILIFGSWLGWLPLGGRCPVSISGECTLVDRGERLILPVLALSVGTIAVLSRYSRAATLDVLNEDYVRTARAKGLKDPSVWFVHVARNTLIPIATFLGPAIPAILSGAVIVEQLFGWQGFGRLALEAVRQQDYPVVMAFIMFGGVSTLVGYLISDILYAVVDPRVRLN